MNGTPDVAVIGGGAIGCAVAYHAARRGAAATLLEAEEIGGGSSGALAGMLSGQGEGEPPGPLLDLMIAGRERHRTLDGQLRESTGLDPGYVWDGALRTATDEDTEERLAAEYREQTAEGLPARWLSAGEIRELEPALSGRVRAGLYLPDDGHVNPPELVRALAAGAASRGARLLEATRVTGFVTRGDRVSGVRTTAGELTAGAVVLAGGAYSGLLSEQLGVRLPLYPMKGQLLVAHLQPSPIKATVWGSDRFYLVPKKDGRLIVGATEEPGVNDRRPTLGGVSYLSRAATALLPNLGGARFVRAWGGLRPATPSGAPILGRVPGADGLLLATGHSRNGVLLSAIIGEILSALALGEPSPVDISAFLPPEAASVPTKQGAA